MNKDLSPYDLPELYDQIFEGFDFDIPFWRATALAAGGPVLDLGCGTGRVLMPLLEAGVDADGVDLYEPMLERARVKAAAGGFHPLLKAADMADFSMPRRYARIICAFNAFAHADTVEAQLATLRASLAHLEPGGGLVIHMSYPGPAYWAEPDGQPVMELETTRASDGHRFQMWDTRTKDIVRQCQSSEIEIRELDAAGAALVSHRVHTTQRWVYRFELELLIRLAGFARSEFFGGFDREPLERPDQQIIAWAWKACYNSSAERGTEQRRPG